MVSRTNADQQIKAIENAIEEQQNSKYYGRLVKWDYDEESKRWTYGIGLTDKKVFSTGRILKVIEPSTSKFIVNLYRQKFNQDSIIERLKYALIYMQQLGRQYNENTWNDEHLARLITTNNAISYKVTNKNNRINKIKKKEINKYIDKNNPHDIIDLINLNANLNAIFPKTWHQGKFWVWVLLAILLCVLPSLSFPLHLIALIIVIILLFINFTEHKWSGFANKQLWNWLELLIIPVILAFGGLSIQSQQAKKQEDENTKKAQQESLKKYYQNVINLVDIRQEKKDFDKENIYLSLTDKLNQEQYREEKKALESFTRLIFSEINGSQKRQVIEFLYGLGLIKCSENKDKTLNCNDALSLNKVDIRNANLSYLSLPNASFKGAYLNNANLSNSNLELVNFENASLEDVNLELARLSNINFANANFGTSDDIKQKWELINKITSLFNKVILKEPPDKFGTSDDTKQKWELINKTTSLFSKVILKEPPDKCRPNNFPKDNHEKPNNSSIKLAYKNELDFFDEDLSKTNLKYLYLCAANFGNANLQDANLEGSNLQNANLKKTKLKGIILEGAYLKAG
jgi:uncharacterized protein YjbI with pentapeptide repeats